MVVGEGSPIDLHALGRYLSATFSERHEVRLAQISGGRSNLTYDLDWGEHRWVLRRPPAGILPPSAHDVLRECPLLVALQGTQVAVPRLVDICREPSVLGTPFYIMERIDGFIITRESPPQIDDPAACRQISEQVVDTLACLHQLDPHQVGLAALGRPSGFIHRQLTRRKAQLDSIMQRCRNVPELVCLFEWLIDHEPAENGYHAIVHGDYGLHNILIKLRPPRIQGVLDWELATLGDPLADLGWLSAQWRDPGEPGYGGTQGFGVSQRPGFLRRAELVNRYEEKTGRHVPNLYFYEALALWRIAIALEGIYAARRNVAAQTPVDDEFESLVPAMATYALDRARAADA